MILQILKDLWLWLTGWPHLWTGTPHGRGGNVEAISYKPGWNAWRFAGLYLTTYLAGTLAGFGVVSLSRAFYDRSLARNLDGTEKYLVASLVTGWLDGLLGARHGAHTGPWLWGSSSRRVMT